jgi:PAS domain S-box-containing protein
MPRARAKPKSAARRPASPRARGSRSKPAPKKRKKPALSFSELTQRVVAEAREARQVAALQRELITLRVKLTQLEKERFDREHERQRFASFFRYAPVAYVVFDRWGCIHDLNHAAIRLLHWQGAPLADTNFVQFLMPSQRERFLRALHKPAEGLGWNTVDLQIVRPGATLDILCSIGTDASTQGNLYYHAVLIDLTESRKVERALRETLLGLQLAGKAAGFGTYEFDVARGQMVWSQELRNILGLPAIDLPLSLDTVREMIHPEDRERAMRLIQRSMQPDGTGRYEDEHRLVLSNGEIRWVLARGRTYFSGDGKQRKAVRAIGVVLDITARRTDEEQLRQAHALLEQRVRERTRELRETNAKLRREITDRRRLEREMLDIIEREQRRFGRDLHDGLGQQMTGLALLGNLLHMNLDAAGHPEAGTAARLRELLVSAGQQVRQLARGLQPIAPEPAGLMIGLEQFAGNASHLYGIECRFVCPEPVLIENPDTAENLYHIVQEAVSNAMRHGNAKKIEIELRRDSGQVLLNITDNGSGLKPGFAKKGGLGLRIMSYRAEITGGRCETLRHSAGGTRISCSAPDMTMTSHARDSNDSDEKSEIDRSRLRRQGCKMEGAGDR